MQVRKGNYSAEKRCKLKAALPGDFPSGSVIKDPPANAGDVFDPWRIPNASEPLSPYATISDSLP